MKAFDRIIGYSEIKTELERLADTLVSTEKYAKLGVTVPMGLILSGEPGVGKTTMAQSFIEATGRKCITCRKARPDGDFIREIVSAFEEAEKQAPSIIFLDDLDKFSNCDERRRDSEEYVTVQSCIDMLKGKDVFVLATANNIDKLPESLVRAGRFDKHIEVETPTGQDAAKITEFYLSGKCVAEDIDAKLIAGIMHGHSCADLETVVNEAGIYAAYKGKSEIGMDELIEACMRIIMGIPEESSETNPYILERIACHEAGHAVIHELLDPGSVLIVTARPSEDCLGGITSCRKSKNYYYSKTEQEHRIMTCLGGKAATEIRFGEEDTGCAGDIRHAYDIADTLAVDLCSEGFYGRIGDRGNPRTPVSDALSERRELLIGAELERFYRQAKKLLVDNRAFFDAVTELLIEKKTLLGTELQTIKTNVESHAA